MKKNITNTWFYTEMPWWGKIFLIYIRGDLFMLLPLILGIVVLSFISLHWGIRALGILIAVRQSGELVYWLLQQFGDRKYRPYDFGFTKLDNNAIYILYQTFAIAGVVCGILLSIASFTFFAP